MQCHKNFRFFLLCALISSAALLNAQSGVFINKGQAENGGVLGGVFIGLSSSITAYQPTTISGGAIGAPQLYWKDIVGIEQIGTTLTKTDLNGWGNAGATSATQIECFENGWVEYRVDNLQNTFAFGLSNSNADAGFESIEYAMRLDAGQLRVYNYGQLKGNFGPVALNDLVRIERMGNILFYSKNNIVLFNHQVDPIEHLLTDIALYNQGAAVAVYVNSKESFKSPLVFRNKGCYINIKTGTSLVVGGKITLENTGQFDNTGKINLKGNWNNNSETPAFANYLSVRSDVVEFSGADQTIGGTSTTIFNDVIWSGSGRKVIGDGSPPVFNGNVTIQEAGTGTIILVNQSKNPVPVSVNGNLTVPRGSIFENNGTGFSLSNNLVIDGTYSGTGGLFFSGSNFQTISGVSVPVINNMNINKSGGNITLSTPLTIGSILTLTKGILITDNIKVLTVNPGATVSGASDSAYVSGPVKKIGNTPFTFPLGDMTLSAGAYHPITITAPTLASDAFTAEYKAAKQPFGEALQTEILQSISNCEYWTLNRSSGTSAVIPSLGWNRNSCIGGNFNNLTLAGWNGTQWNSLGVADIKLDGLAGTITGLTGIGLGVYLGPVTYAHLIDEARPFFIAPCDNDLTRNWISSKIFDGNGNPIAESRVYSDYLGRATQTQTRNITENNVLASQTIYDAYGRGVLQTLAAPIDENYFCYKNKFITNTTGINYSYTDFDIPNNTTLSSALTLGEVDRPKPVGKNLSGTLGNYYSSNNTDELYVPASSFPYTRVEYDDNNGGVVKRSSMAGEILRMGLGHEAQTYTMPASGELRYLYGYRSGWQSGSVFDVDDIYYFPGTFSGIIPTPPVKAVKTISVDQNGIEAVTFTDLGGKLLATCLSGQENGENVRTMHMLSVIKTDVESQRYMDIHLPQGCQSTLILDNLSNALTYNILNLKTGKYVQFGSGIDFTGTQPNLPAGFYRIIYKQGAIQGVPTPKLFARYDVNYYNFSINYYDKAGRLIKTIPPIGIDYTYVPNPSLPSAAPAHTMPSLYSYNSLGWLLFDVTPDEGKTEYVYKIDGNIRFTQNAKQFYSNSTAALRKFSYTNYDASNRVVETGEYDPTLAGGSSTSLSNGNFAFENYYDYNPIAPPCSTCAASVHTITESESGIFGLDPLRCTQQNYVAYDVADPDFYTQTGLATTDYKQEFVLYKVSKTWNDAKTSWYSYDEQGRMVWLVQRIENAPTAGNSLVKTVNYNYDFNGNVTEVDFQKEVAAEDFYHYYTYDADKRLMKVQTSTDGTIKEEQANYSYYKNGALKRVELANKLQGVDYVYTINGWLKSMNAPELDNRDPGKDGANSSVNHVPKDLFGMTLDYFAGDYVRPGTFIQTYDTPENYEIQAYDPTAHPPAPVVEKAKNLYNGLIKAQRWQTQTPSTNALSYQNAQLMYGYLYDKKYQLTDATFGAIAGAGTLNKNPLPPGQFEVFGYYGPTLAASTFDNYKVSGITYDLNGNIKTLNRNAFGGTGTNAMDQLSYNYLPNSNKLHQVTDAISSNIYTSLNLKAGQSNNNYAYNEIGQLLGDANESSYYTYNVAGKVTAVFSNEAFTQLKATFVYDEKGFRLKKTSYNSAGIISKETWYIRDASGNELSVYEKPNGGTIAQTETGIFGASRLGIYNSQTNKNSYELADHLGNVRTTFTKQVNYYFETKFDGIGEYDYLFDHEATDYSYNKSGTGGGTTNGSATADATSPIAASITIPVANGQVVTTNAYWYFHDRSPNPQIGIFVQAGFEFILKDLTGTVISTFAANNSGMPDSWHLLNNVCTVNTNGVSGVFNLTINMKWIGPYPVPVSFDDISISLTPNTSGIGIIKPEQLSLADYYPHGGIMPGRNYVGANNYRFGYQGQFAEKDAETGFNNFELRMWDGKLGRWMNPDPYRQHHSPYLGMSNNPINSVDPDGGYDDPGGYLVDGNGYTQQFSNMGDDEGLDYYIYGHWNSGDLSGSFSPNGNSMWVPHDISGGASWGFLSSQKGFGSFNSGAEQIVQTYTPTTMDNWSTSNNFFAQLTYGFADGLYMTSQFFWDPKYKDHLNGDAATSSDRIGAFVNTVAVPVAFEASAMAKVSIAAKTGERAFFSGAGTEAKAIEQGFQTLGQTRAGQNLQNLITSKNIPWSQAEPMWQRLSATWAKGIPNGSSVPVFLNNPRAGAVWFQTELPILQSKGVNLIYK